MEEVPLRYDVWVEDALRGVVRQAIAWASENGLPGEHHFYVTFETHAHGVEIPDFLHAEYPEEMIIVIQHRFWDLKVTDDAFEVTLIFRGVAEHLRIPLEAVTRFSDPAGDFDLKLKVTEVAADEVKNIGLASVAGGGLHDEEAGVPSEDEQAPELDPTAEEKKPGEVITLDAFRKK